MEFELRLKLKRFELLAASEMEFEFLSVKFMGFKFLAGKLNCKVQNITYKPLMNGSLFLVRWIFIIVSPYRKWLSNLQ